MRPARPDELDQVGQLTVTTYVTDGMQTPQVPTPLNSPMRAAGQGRVPGSPLAEVSRRERDWQPAPGMTLLAFGATTVTPRRKVYRWCMSRTNIDIDDDLIAEVMRKLSVKTKKEAVDLALRRVAGPQLTSADFDAVRGVGFEIDLAELRGDRVSEW